MHAPNEAEVSPPDINDLHRFNRRVGHVPLAMIITIPLVGVLVCIPGVLAGLIAAAGSDEEFRQRVENTFLKRLVSGATVVVKGRITDVRGHPIAGARVTGIQEIIDPGNMHNPHVVKTVSRPDGSYELTGLNPPSVWRTAGFLNGGDPTLDGHSFYLIVRIEAEGFVQPRGQIPRFPRVTQDLLDSARRLLKLMGRIQACRSGRSEIREKEGLPALPASQGNVITGIDIILDRRPDPASLSGRILDTKGKPASNRVVGLWPVDREPLPGDEQVGGRQWVETTTDSNGMFAIPTIAPGQYATLVYGPAADASARRMYQEPVHGRLIEVKSGACIQGLEIRVRPPEDYAISGQARDARGHPVHRVTVLASIPHGSSWWDETDSDGRFCLDGLDGMGVSRVSVTFQGAVAGGGFKLVIPNIPVNSKNVNVTVPDRGGIHGTVLRAASEAGVTTCQVTVPSVRLAECGAIWENPDVRITQKEDGSFHIAGVPAGRATVEVRAEGLGVQRFTVPVEAGKTHSFDCRMLGPAILEGRTTLDGTPKGTSIVIDGEWLRSDEHGHFRFDQFPNGDYTIWFFGWGDGWNHRSTTVRLTSGQTTRLDMEMGGSCEVRGTIRFAEEQGACSVRLAATPAPDGWPGGGRPVPEEFVLSYDRVGKSGGRYRLRAIPPGRWYLMAGQHRPFMHRYPLAISKVIELRAGEILSLDLDLTAHRR